MEHESFVPIPAPRVTAALKTPGVVAAGLPGWQPDADAGADLRGRLRLRVGGSTITYRATVGISGTGPTFTVEASGTEVRGTGAVKLTAEVTVAAAQTPEPGTALTWRGTAEADGRLTSYEPAIVEAAVRRLLDRFSAQLAENAPEWPERPEPGDVSEHRAGAAPTPGDASKPQVEAAPTTEDVSKPQAGPAPTAEDVSPPGPGAASPSEDASPPAPEAATPPEDASAPQPGRKAAPPPEDAPAPHPGREAASSSEDASAPPPEPEAAPPPAPEAAPAPAPRGDARPEPDEEPDVVDDSGEPAAELDDFELVEVEVEVPESAAALDDLVPPAEAAHARRTMIGRSAEEVDHAPPRGRYAPVPAPDSASATATLRWAAPAAAALLASAVVVGRVLRRRR